MKNGYDENNNYNKSDETKCATNYSITNKIGTTRLRLPLPPHRKGPGILAKRKIGIVKFCGCRLTPCPCSSILPVLPGLDPQEGDDKNFECSRKMIPLEQVDFQKRFLKYSGHFVHPAAIKNRG